MHYILRLLCLVDGTNIAEELSEAVFGVMFLQNTAYQATWYHHILEDLILSFQ